MISRKQKKDNWRKSRYIPFPTINKKIIEILVDKYGKHESLNEFNRLIGLENGAFFKTSIELNELNGEKLEKELKQKLALKKSFFKRLFNI